MEELRTAVRPEVDSVEAETDRIMKTGALWLAAVLIAVALLVGPLVGSGWRPSLMPVPLDAAWWLGAIAIAVGTALLMWAGCPVLGFPLEQAHRQKVFSIRVGIALSLAGIALAGLAVLVAPLP